MHVGHTLGADRGGDVREERRRGGGDGEGEGEKRRVWKRRKGKNGSGIRI